MIQIVPKPTDTPDDNSTAHGSRGDPEPGRGLPAARLLTGWTPSTLPFERRLVWVCGLTQDEHQFEVLQALSVANTLVNTPAAIGTCASKVLTTALLMRHDIPSPRTLFTSTRGIAENFLVRAG